jgi:hypothetical protein
MYGRFVMKRLLSRNSIFARLADFDDVMTGADVQAQWMWLQTDTGVRGYLEGMGMYGDKNTPRGSCGARTS